MILSSNPGKRRWYFADQRRIKAPVPIARNRQLQRAFRRQRGLGAAAVAMVGYASLGLPVQVHVHLGVEHPLR
jgi:hypothetical protein